MDKKVAQKIVLVALLLWSSIAFAQHEHSFFTGDVFAVEWTQDPPNALGWEWRIERVSDGVVIAQDETNESTVTVSINSAGLYVFYCRAWNNYDVDPPERSWSNWADSISDGIVDGVERAWQIKINLRPVGPLIIDYNRYLP